MKVKLRCFLGNEEAPWREQWDACEKKCMPYMEGFCEHVLCAFAKKKIDWKQKVRTALTVKGIRKQLKKPFKLPTFREAVQRTLLLKEQGRLLNLKQAPIKPRLGGAASRAALRRDGRTRSVVEEALGAAEAGAGAAQTAWQSEENAREKKKRVQTCSYCGEAGHRYTPNKREVPMRITCPKKLKEMKKGEPSSAAL